jgi:short subunit dehydrogenase-like uncharacterized protein
VTPTVLLGATGYTGRLTAEAIVARGDRPVLAGRDAARLLTLAEELGGLETAVADVARPETVSALIGPGDVLVTTVGPFARWGDAAVEAAIEAGAIYLDSNGEPGFIRRVFEHFDGSAAGSRAVLLPAFAYESVPGNLAAALALREASGLVERIDIGYFITGDASGWMSGGTRASSAHGIVEPAFAWREGIRDERPAARARSFEVAGEKRGAISVGSCEHFTVPRIYPNLSEVNVYLDQFGAPARALQALSAASAPILKVPTVRSAVRALVARFVKGSRGGPDQATRSSSGVHIAAIAYRAGEALAAVELEGINGYEFTARILAWGSSRAADGRVSGVGALGPVEAFGLAELEAGVADAGLQRVEPARV